MQAAVTEADGPGWVALRGVHVRVHRSTAMGFDHPTAMLLEHFDVPDHAGTTFVLGDNVFHPVAHFRQFYPASRIVVYQLEQMVGSETWHPVDRIVEHLRGADAVWDFDPLNAVFLGWRGVVVDRVVPMLYTHSLERVSLREQPRIDVLFTGYLNDRRHRIFSVLQQRLYQHRVRLMWLQGVEGPDLDHYIGDARIVLNLHAFEPWHRQEQTRIFYPLINGRMVVSETSETNWFGDAIVEAEVDGLADALLHWLAKDRWRGYGLEARGRFRRQTAAWLAQQPEVAAA
jgi:hypothetical protein